MASSSPAGVEGSDLSSINTMMSAVMAVGNVAENGGSPPRIKSPSKAPGPNRIGRRNQETKEEKSSYSCPLCEKLCSTQHQLTMHIRQHNTDTGGADHSCSICGKSLSSASSLDRHMLVHSGERPYKCTVCGQSFTTNGNMHRHMKIHEKDPTGATASAPPSPLKRRRLSSKRKLSHDAESEKEDLVSAKKTLDDGSVDLEKAGDELLHCPICFKEFVCRYSLESHVDAHSENPLRCDVCCVTFRTHRGLLRHNALVHKQLPRDAAGRPFIQNNPAIPAGFHDLGFTDFSCRKFPRISQAWCETNLRRCISEQHRCVCDTCDKAFPMPAALTLHAQTHAAPAPARSPPADAPDQKLFLALLGLQHTREVGPAPAEELPPDDNQAIQQQALRGPLPPEPGCPAVLGLSATALGGPLAVLPFQKGFLLQPDSGIVVKPVSSESAVELADIQQILQMAAAAPPHLGLPPLSKAPAAPLQTIFKHMPPLKPKPLVTPRTLVAASTPPPLVSAQQTSPGCTSPSLPPPPLKLLRGAVEAASQAHLLQSKSGAPAAPLFLPAPRSEPPGPADVQAQLEQDGLLEALLPLGVEAKIKQEVTEAELKAIMVGPGGKKAPAVRKVLYPCRFCNQVFAFSGVLRAHVRSHLGISPYQCNICDYIAADKAALIRHLRTHSGERPYICRICQYPFTVKANCERHLRKKHLKATRKDIEKNIEYVTSSAAELVDAFCAPDTVCRLCGQDLQHHRALRVHMRTHCARPRKPFECRECSAAFTARRNCVHHVLKQHLHVPESDIDAYVLAVDAAPGPASASERKPLAAFLEPHNGFLHAAGAAPLPHVTVKLEPAGGFPVHLSEPLDFSQKGLALVHVKQESPGVFLSAGPAPYDCSMEPIDLSVPKSLRRGDKETPVLAEGKKPAQDADGTEPPAAPLPAPAGSGAVPEKPKPPGGPSAASAPDGGPTQALQGPVRLAVPIYPSTLVSGAGLLGGPALLRPLRPKPPLLLPKPPASEELPPLASIAQIISSVSSAPTLLRAKVTDPGPGLATADSSGVPKAATSPAECSDPPPAPPVASSPEPTSPPDLGPAGVSKKRGRKRALRSRLRAPSGGLDLDSSGEFASVEKMLATTDSHRFTPFLQTAQDGPQQDASGEEQPGPLDDKAQQGRPAPSPGCPQRLSCPHCPRVFPWASSLQRHLLTHTGQKPFPCQTCDAFFSTKSNCERHQLRRHGLGACSPRRNGLLARRAAREGAAPDSTDSQSDAETAAATGGLVLDLTSKEKELLPSPEAGGHPAEEDEEEAEEEEEDGEDAAAVESPGPGDGCGAEGKDADGPESDTVSNKSLDLNLASTLMGFKLGTGPPEQKQACGVCGKTFKFLGTLSRHRKAHEHGDAQDEAQGAGGPQEGSPAAAPEPQELPAEPLEAPAEKQGEEGEGPSDGEAERLAERSGGGGAAGLAASKADKRKKVCSVCSKRFWSLQDLTRHMRSHTGERPYKCQTCARTFTLKHSLVRHQRVHQKARHARPQGKDSDRDEAAGEDSGSESTHSGTHPPSESEAVGPQEDGAGRTAGSGQAEADEPQPESPTPALEPQEPRGKRPGPPPDGSPPPGLE